MFLFISQEMLFAYPPKVEVFLSNTFTTKMNLTCIVLLDTSQNMSYNISMIKSFKHKGLKEFFDTGSTKGIQAEHSNKLRIILGALDVAKRIEVLNIPAFKLHQLKGDMQELWSIKVNGNWRITFKFIDEDVYVVDYQDYH